MDDDDDDDDEEEEEEEEEEDLIFIFVSHSVLDLFFNSFLPSVFDFSFVFQLTENVLGQLA